MTGRMGAMPDVMETLSDMNGALIRPDKMELFSGGGPKGWSVGAGNQAQFLANRGFRAQAAQRRRRRTQAGYGYPEATPKPHSGHLVANR